MAEYEMNRPAEYEMKRLADVEVVAEPTDETHVLVEQDGEIKRAPKNQIGAQADWAETDENSPAFVKNKPDVGGGVLWLNLNSIYEGPLAWEDGTPITKDEFIEAFDTSRIMTRDTYTEGGKYTSTVVGYFVNNSTSYIALHGMKALGGHLNEVKPVTFAQE